ncbi:MAG: DUF2442 domain-containing protein [Candidatus Aenigmarchaeota archaeon]|nr:DUF2442 domain-containing protein [Candidatus Aenigmarchaeota archaeon]
MSISAVEIEVPYAENVRVTKDTLSVDLSDGRTISAPLDWFPRLVYATQKERNNWRLIGRGHGIHWEDIDEDISVEGLLAEKPSGESQSSIKKWLNRRPKIRIKNRLILNERQRGLFGKGIGVSHLKGK